MATQRFFIAPYDKDSGLTTNTKPWIIPDNAFSTLNNAYVFRGRVRKRFGSRPFSNDPLLSRLRVQVATTDGGGSASGTVPAAAGAIGQAFYIGTTVFTVQALGTPVTMLATGPFTTATFDTSSGAFVFTGVTTGVPVWWYPALPVMGLLTQQKGLINNDFLIGFDTKYAYQYLNGWTRLANGSSVWQGTDSEFFWGTTWTGETASEKYFFVTNFDNTDPNYMRYLDATLTWNVFQPIINTVTGPPSIVTTLDNCRLIVVFQNRLLCLNTWETTVTTPAMGPVVTTSLNYTNRVRWSYTMDPTAQSVSFLEGPTSNALDASTTESIISAEFIKNRLIVYFEKSTWELAYTGNQIQPFVWQQINTELGAESTFSIVPFDKVALGIGNVGVHACNGANVERIDDKIPDTVFAIHNEFSGPERVCGIRDYFTELVYWTFPGPDTSADQPYPRQVLVYNYKTGTWSLFDDSITTFGYFQPLASNTIESVSWDSTTVTWDDAVPWGSGSTQTQFRQVVAGNQEGFTFVCDSEVMTNSLALQITNVTTNGSGQTALLVINHNLRYKDYIFIQGAVWSDSSNGLNGKIFQVTSVVDPNNFTIGPTAPYTGTYKGGGLISLVSKITITTKEFNFFAEQGRNAYISKVDFLVDKTESGQITVNYFVSTSSAPLLQDSFFNGSLVGTGVLETFAYTSQNMTASPVQFENFTTRVWHPVYFQADGEVIQFQLTFSYAQMINPAVRNQDFELHAVCIYAEKTSYRFQ